MNKFDQGEQRGENGGKVRNDTPVPPASPLIPNHPANPIANSL